MYVVWHFCHKILLFCPVVKDSHDATDLWTALQAIELHFFFTDDSGFVILWIPEVLYSQIFVGPDIWIPFTLNLYQVACSVSTQPLMSTNSATNIDFSMVDYFYKIQSNNDVFIYIINLVLDL